MKKTSFVVALLLAFSLFATTPSLAADKTLDLYLVEDVEETHGAYEALHRFLYADIIDGYVTTETIEMEGEDEPYEYTDVLLKPENNITRAQFTKILVNALNLEMGEEQKSFSDVTSDDWYYDYVQIASSHGIVQGNVDGTFKPHANMTRAHMALMIYRAFEETIDFGEAEQVFTDVRPENSAYEAIAKVAEAGIVQGYGELFKPSNVAKRSHAVLMIDRALHLEPGLAEEEADILAVVERNITDELAIFDQEIDVEALEQVYRETTTGYLLASSLLGQDLYGDEELGLSMVFEQVGEHATSIATLNKRFAVVRIDNLHVNLDIGDEEMSLSMKLDISGNGYLKKMADGSWKMYHIQYDDEDLNL